MATLNENSSIADNSNLLRKGFLQASTNWSGTNTLEIANVGKTFGRLGQGLATLPENTTGFRWKAAGAGSTTSMIVSIFPANPSDTMATGNYIQFNVREVDWATLSAFNKPSRPSASTDPVAIGASILLASVAGTGALAMSLF